MNETIKLADGRLSAAFRQVGYRLGSAPGVIDGTTVHDAQGRYLFAWHRHEHHLLFYVRMEALKIRSTLRQKAIFNHLPERLNKNNGKETTIRLESDEEAETLLRWLSPNLPLS